jgi:hypothetical protein
MLFKLPDPPAGQSYVTKPTANGPTTVLVPTNSLSEDVCAATGRTWAEEARLYNIRNAPDGQPIAKPGDPFYQTAESMKNRDKAVAGGVSAGSLKFFNMISGTSADNPPNLSDTMDKIKNGTINADITASLDKIGQVSGSLPGVSSTQLSAAKADIAAKMAKAQADLPKLLAMAQANVDILTKKKIASTGKPPTEAEIKAAQGALTIFQDGPKLLESKAAEISKAVTQAGPDFGAKVPAGITSVANFAKAGLTKITALATIAGGKITEFALGVPSQTIPDPLNSTGPAIPNPAYATFAAIPANATKITKLADISTKMNEASADMTTKFAAIETAQATAVTGGMADLKAFAFAAQLSQPATGFKATIQDFTLDKNAFDPTSISKTFASASKLGPSIDTSLYKSTKDEDLTYKGDDGIVWDRTNAERLRRSLPGLAAIGSPRPLDPPLVPAGPTPPKAPETILKVEKPKDPGAVPASASPTVKKRAVFDKDTDERIYNPFVKEYLVVLNVFIDAVNSASSTLDADVIKWMDIGKDFDALRTAGAKIKTEKPDTSTYTEEEKVIVKERSFYLGILKAYSDVWRKYTYANDRRNELTEQFNILRAAFMAGKTFGDLPLSVETAVMKDKGPVGWKTSSPESYYKSFSEFAKANPDKAKLPTA